MITSLHMGTDDLEAHVNALEAKYRRAEKHETRAEHWYTEDADIVLVGYGIVGRILKAVVADARANGDQGWSVAAHHPLSVPHCGLPAPRPARPILRRR